ncbi:hypothetical protein V6B14_22395 (plasmid) [Sporosarcina psychrophila]|uniref:hypothetical protein n=1 Tax=Sporosarcina psychrophila TaxID=1476 RepID=UPI0030CA7D62
MKNNRRQEQIKKVDESKSIFGKKEYYYLLNHTYDLKPSSICFKSKINFEAMELLVANLQFKAEGIKEPYSFEQSDMRNILIDHFQCEGEPESPRVYNHIDLYLNWEKWCGVADLVSSIGHFQKEEVLRDLEKLINIEQ